MSQKTVSYGPLSFPCSRHGPRKLDNAFDAQLFLERGDVAEICRTCRPAIEKIRFLWMRRFLKDMHWLPLIEVLIGCDRETNPGKHGEFLRALERVNPVRVCHRPWGGREAGAWVAHLKDHVKQVCIQPRALSLVGRPITEVAKGGDVFFVSSECEEAATRTRTTESIWLINSWTHYRHTRIGRRELTADENRAILLGCLDPSDLAAKACRLILATDSNQ